jgi:hypothetical protein
MIEDTIIFIDQNSAPDMVYLVLGGVVLKGISAS